MPDPACQVSLEIGHAVAVLSIGTVNDTIVQNGVQTIETVARHIEVRVQHEAHGTLRHRSAHDASLARVNLEALLALPAVAELELPHRAGVKTACELIPPISTKNKHRVKS